MDNEKNTPILHDDIKEPAHRIFNIVRNVFALLTAICFIASFLLHERQLLVRGIGYCFGFVAYFAEVLELTEGFNRKKHLDDLFMAICFGGLYVFMAISYIMEHYGQ